jgi:hypothetical protein
VLNEMMMNWKGYGSKQSWPNLKYISQHLPRGTEENDEKPCSQDSWSPG